MDIPAFFEQFGTIAGALAGAFLALEKTKSSLSRFTNSKPLLRTSIKADLELLKLMESGDPGYEELKNHIKSQVEAMVKEEQKKELITGNFFQIFVGLAMTSGFGYWTYVIATTTISIWWTILTVWGALAGFGFLMSATEKSSPNKKIQPTANASADS